MCKSAVIRRSANEQTWYRSKRAGKKKNWNWNPAKQNNPNCLRLHYIERSLIVINKCNLRREEKGKRQIGGIQQVSNGNKGKNDGTRKIEKSLSRPKGLTAVRPRCNLQ